MSVFVPVRVNLSARWCVRECDFVCVQTPIGVCLCLHMCLCLHTRTHVCVCVCVLGGIMHVSLHTFHEWMRIVSLMNCREH